MNSLKTSLFGALLGTLSIAVHAEEQKPVLTLPTMTIMAEPEMSNETGYVPFIENEANRLALQHQVIRGTKDAENFMVNPNVLANLDIKPTQAPDLSLLSPALQQYVMTIAQGLQSSDPTQGLYTLLENVGIDRSSSLQPGRGLQLQINLDKVNLGLLENYNNPSPVAQFPRSP